jgi:hypothetical protein
MVTHSTTNQPACSLSMAERTGSPVFHTLWSYVIDIQIISIYIPHGLYIHVYQTVGTNFGIKNAVEIHAECTTIAKRTC